MYLIDSTSQMILNSTMFNVFKEVSSVHQACIYLIQITAKNCKMFYYLQ